VAQSLGRSSADEQGKADDSEERGSHTCSIGSRSR
jgi:hypothetical protein